MFRIRCYAWSSAGAIDGGFRLIFTFGGARRQSPAFIVACSAAVPRAALRASIAIDP